MKKTKKYLAALTAAVMTAALTAVMPAVAEDGSRDKVYDSSLILDENIVFTIRSLDKYLKDNGIRAVTALGSGKKVQVHAESLDTLEPVKAFVKESGLDADIIEYGVERFELTGGSSDSIAELPSNMSTQEDALRYRLDKYINDNNIDAWIYDKESSPDGIIFIGYYRKNENIPLEIIAQVEKNGFDPHLVNFVQEDHEKDGLIEDIDVIKRLINWYIFENKLNAGIVPEFELIDSLDSNVLYVEYTAEKTDIPEKLAAYIEDRKIDPELVKTGVSGSFSKQNESTVGISFEEFSKLTEDEVKVMFEEKGLTDSMHYRLWTEEKLRNELVCGEVWALLKPNPFPVSNPELADDYKVYWEDDRFASALELPEESFTFKQNSTVRVAFGDENGSDNNEYCSCYINPKTANNAEAVKLLTVALNYVQLSPYFVGFYYNYWGTAVNPIGNIPDKTISNYSFEELLAMSDEELGSFNDKIEGVENVATFGELYSKKIKEAGNDYFNSYTNRGILKVSVEVDNIDILKDLMETKMVENSDGKLVEIEMVSNSKVAYLLNIPAESIAKAKIYESTPILDLDINVNKHSDKIKALVLYEIVFEPSINKLIKNYHIEMPAKSDIINGDANCDGTTDMSDVVLIMQALANPNKYGENGTAEVHLTAQGKANADMDGNGLTVGDAQTIQTMLLGIE
ncbi:dockerin type I repeat-containing protein [Ruminococcus sp.]|uniref:dockerin type I repeat-containing protein n=1 Tax=Ruminococcus sp. TaxID=41978 RepID=UPI0025D324F2|nr:dockerin type I repeat-containing protein [Ruminococcus sp.]MCR4638782.1 dockerin type I repeat-containing protein [Ruminococcus sp.]